jgi:hypothetical protein
MISILSVRGEIRLMDFQDGVTTRALRAKGVKIAGGRRKLRSLMIFIF